jgi:hypothetical protein
MIVFITMTSQKNKWRLKNEAKLLKLYDTKPNNQQEEVKYYPLVWLVPNGFTFNTEARLVSYQFAMLVMDRQFESSSNTIEVLSDTAGIIVDIVTLIKRNVTETDFDISVNGQADAFFDSRSDVVCGHGINFTINTPYLESYCDIPT